MDAPPAVFSVQDLPDTLIKAANAMKDDSLRIEFEEEREERFANFDSDDSNTLSAVEFVEYLTEIIAD